MQAVRRNRVGIASTICIAIVMWASASARADPWREVKNPHFGEVLFYFFQEDYFTALTQLTTAQHFGRMAQHADEAELLRGGMLLSYGLHLEAGRIFQALIDAGAPPKVRDRAWFFLAKIRYQRGYIVEAEDAMARIGGPLPAELEDERRVLHATLLLQRQQYREAVAMLRQVSSSSEWGIYGRYNLGVALVQAGEASDGLGLLDEIGRDSDLRKRGETMAALRDKANVALGFLYLRNQSPDWAKLFLDRVRLDGLMSTKALLGLGWAHVSHNEHERALAAWTVLTQRSVSDTAVQEALLAVPYSYGKLGAYRQSLQKYERALDAYTEEMARLDESIEAIRGGALIENILRNNPGEESGWFWRVQNLPDSPESRYLSELLASHPFQEGIKNYRDLTFLIRHLDKSSRSIQVFRDMLATRRQAHAQRLPRVIAGERALDLERVRANGALYRTELARIEQEADAEALATDKEKSLLARLERMRVAMARIKDPAERGRVQEKQRLLRGLLSWDLAAQSPERLWEAKKGMREVDRLLEQVEAHRQALAKAQVDVPSGLAAFDGRIDAIGARIEGLRAGTQLAAREQEQQLATLAIDELARRREQIAAYIVQARFAVAQIYDQALRAPEPGKTP